MANNANDVISIAQGEVGYSRWTDTQAGTKYGRWYAELTGSSYYGQSGVPYCAMFVSWVMNQAGATAPGIPGAYCPWILTAGQNAGRTVSTSSAQKGDLVLFDWEGDGTTDHIGFVVSNNGSSLYTVEGNTNNGTVANRTRSYSYVSGIIRPYYDGTSSSTSSDTVSSSGTVDVDGWWGKATTTALQQQLGTTVDGIISGQYTSDKAALPRCASTSWEWSTNGSSTGSDLIRALQNKVGANADGFCGKNTVTAIQTYMRNQFGYKKHAIDGSCGEYTVYNIQNAINAGLWK